jgi:hypothetical protein
MPAQKTILAVAIGCNSDKSKVIKDSSDKTLKGVRPYIRGLINWLSNQPDPPDPTSSLPRYRIGDANDYVIDYREYTAAELKRDPQKAFTVSSGLPTSHVILCMSLTVAREAADFTRNMNPKPPIVAIVSDPFAENFPENVCGVSAKRPQHVIECYDKFRAADPTLTKIYALNKQGYPPSENSMRWLGGKVIPVPIGRNDDCDDIKRKIDQIPSGSHQGLLVCPVDQFFGAAEQIAIWANANSMRDFWTVPDWPTGSFGGYGFPQETCGQYLAERIASIWSNNDNIPDPSWVPVDDKWIAGKP